MRQRISAVPWPIFARFSSLGNEIIRPEQDSFSIFDIVHRFGAILYFVKVTPGKSGQKVTFLAPNQTPLKNSKIQKHHVNLS